ncbi:MAG: adenosine deaminase [Gammaproteobacteria bacterium]|nr:adenosine deaminase [Gammaproteobacteria bacterium]
MSVSDTSRMRNFPKIELHRHLDGSIRQQTIIDIARRHKLDIDISDPAALKKRSTVTEPMQDLAAVLDAFDIIQKVSCSYEAIKRIAFENVEDAFFDGIKLCELRFSPAFIALGKDIAYDEIIEGVIDGVAAGMDKYDIQIGLITIVSRTLDYEANKQGTIEAITYAQKAKHRMADRIVGFDLADLENTTEPEDFVELVEMARDAGLGITVHSGEDTDASGVQKTLEILKPDRIGHGVNAWQDRDVVELLKEQDVLLEICPTSNWLTQCVPVLAEHPLPDFFHAGVKVSLNSDDPQLMDIDLTHEYEIARQTFGFSNEDLLKMNLYALEKSFLPAEIGKAVQKQFFT